MIHHRDRAGGRLLGGTAAGLIIAGAAVLGFDSCQGSGPPRPGAGAARTQAAGGSGRGTRGPVLPDSPPVRVDIPRIGVHSRLLSVGLEKDGSIAVPPLSRANLAGWYDDGPAPGELGPAVLVGHVDTKKGPAVFFKLGLLRPGDVINVTRRDGTVAVFTVDSIEQVPKSRFPTRRVYGDVAFAGLRLITCGGDFKGHSYTANTIVYAHLTSSHR